LEIITAEDIMEIAGTMAKIAVVITVIANEDTLHSLMSHGGARRCLRHLRSKETLLKMSDRQSR
jgi:hypothetical protein